jgi:enoyl-CoA hydratase
MNMRTETPMDNGLIKQECIEKILVLTLNRPERRNALSKALLTHLDTTLRQIEVDDTVSAVIIIGAGDRAFCAGADINEQRGFSPEDAYEHMRFGHAIFDRLEALPTPTIAAINGFALGGGLELALACDIRLASSQASLGLPEITLANIPGWGATQRLPRLIGPSRAKQMMFTGRPVSAENAERYGLVNGVYEPDQLLDECLGLARHIANNSTEALACLKRVVATGLSLGQTTGSEAEARGVAELWGIPAQKAAQEAFFARKR